MDEDDGTDRFGKKNVASWVGNLLQQESENYNKGHKDGCGRDFKSGSDRLADRVARPVDPRMSAIRMASGRNVVQAAPVPTRLSTAPAGPPQTTRADSGARKVKSSRKLTKSGRPMAAPSARRPPPPGTGRSLSSKAFLQRSASRKVSVSQAFSQQSASRKVSVSPFGGLGGLRPRNNLYTDDIPDGEGAGWAHADKVQRLLVCACAMHTCAPSCPHLAVHPHATTRT